MESANQELASEKDSLSRRVDELELANEELTSKNHELSTTLEQYASATASRKPTFSINYSSERNNLDSLSSVKSRCCPKRSKNLRCCEYGIEFLLMLAHHAY
ncbi:MAG: hypothetical protein LBU34_07255 [Planctomycetaceae bacterium]|nr:hypothetical protein [Planctomycetaceae bacterium]